MLCIRRSHVLQASGLSWKEGQLDFTGAQMVLTLKLIAIGVCYQDGRSGQSYASHYRQSMRLPTLPGLLEYYSYCFAYGNLLAGPFFEAKEYFDFMARQVGVFLLEGGGLWMGIERFFGRRSLQLTHCVVVLLRVQALACTPL